jgi:negative regulator of sigma E activity
MNKIMHPIEPEELMAYLDGELTANRATATAAHLGECAECQSIVAGFRGVSQVLKTWKAEPAESDMPQAIAAGLAENQPASRSVFPERRKWRELLGRRWPAVAWVGGVAGVLLVAFGTVRFIGGNANSVVSSVGSQMAQVPAPAQRRDRDKLEMFAKLQQPSTVRAITQQSDQSAAERGLVTNGPMIIRTAQLSLITKEFDKARANLEAILKRHRGYVGELKAGGSTGSGRTLTATLRVPADQLDATLTEVKVLGRVESESQGGQDVTSQYVDLQARLANARNTEQRLTDLLRNRTGKLSDVLEVEQELDRVRGEIEQMEAERKNMSHQVSYATLNATITEDYEAQLQVVPPSTSTRLSNAAVEGYRSMADGVVGLVLFLLSTGPSLLLWGAALFFPARLVWKRVRRTSAT